MNPRNIDNDIDNLLLRSSSVQKIERNGDKLQISVWPLFSFLNGVKVILAPQVLRKGTSVRYYKDEHQEIVFFANEVHRCQTLRQWGFDDEWIKTRLLPEPQMAEVISLPIEFEENQSENEEEQIAV